MANNDFVGFPDDWPEYHNACSDPCDVLQGPCACGAWHKLYEWDFIKKTRRPTGEIMEAHSQHLAQEKLIRNQQT